MAVLKGWGEEILSQVIEVSIDRSGNYRSLVQKYLSNAAIVANRFHVMKLVNEALTRARNHEKNPITLIREQRAERLRELITD